MLALKLDNTFSATEAVEILCDDATMRPGGRMFWADTHLIRPCQDCKNDYGEALIFKECAAQGTEVLTHWRLGVKDLTLDTAMYAKGIHTYSATANMEVIDIKTRRFNLLNLASRLVGKIINC